jgi:hypothetical protein
VRGWACVCLGAPSTTNSPRESTNSRRGRAPFAHSWPYSWSAGVSRPQTGANPMRVKETRFGPADGTEGERCAAPSQPPAGALRSLSSWAMPCAL